MCVAGQAMDPHVAVTWMGDYQHQLWPLPGSIHHRVPNFAKEVGRAV